MNKRMKAIQSIVIVALASAILFVQEEILVFLPNIQLTVFLIVLYTKCFGLSETMIIILIHTILDNILMGSLSPIYFPFMLLGWELLAILVWIFRKAEKPWQLSIIGGAGAIIYPLCFLIPQVIITKVDPMVYLIEDIPFTIILVVSSVLSILWLYKPLKKVLMPFIKI